MEPIEETLFGIRHKTQAINSKVKGNRNELNVTKLLSDWVGKEFTRVPMSGGLRWKNREMVCGDVVCTDPDFKFIFSIETKFYKNLGLKYSDPYLRTNSMIYKFMAQCQRDAAAAGKYPFLMVRENGMPKDLYYVFLPATFIQYTTLIEQIGARWITKDQSIIGFYSHTFFARITYKNLKLLYGK